jgi:Ni,Fe-hydrogenase III small subunit/formate hydrogenlyase subunit 6/NADH:ubiquinone oxidoreductase subunit I
MFEILTNSLKTGIATTSYPDTPPDVSGNARGKPEIDWANWKDARPAAAACPTAAIEFHDDKDVRTASLDLAKCVFCGLCAEADPAIRMTSRCELAARGRSELRSQARYRLDSGGAHRQLLESPAATPEDPALTALAEQLRSRIHSLFGRSLHIREVDAGSCNGCEVEIQGLNSPVYDAERFGVQFVASPRHADMLLVTGPVTRNMELALRKTYDATPDPRLVVAVGACGCSGGIFGRNYATCGAVDTVIPVDVYIPGCPPNPYALLHGILLAISKR